MFKFSFGTASFAFGFWYSSHSCRDSARKHLCKIVHDHIFRTTLMLYITRNLGHDNLRPVFTSAEYARLSNDRFKTRSLADDTKVHFLLILTSVAPSQIIKPLHLECSEQETFWKHRDHPKASSYPRHPNNIFYTEKSTWTTTHPAATPIWHWGNLALERERQHWYILCKCKDRKLIVAILRQKWHRCQSIQMRMVDKHIRGFI